MRYVIGTGWWCSDVDGTEGKEFGLKKVGTRAIRSQRFFDVWLYFVRRYTKPQKIVVVDSASPIKPPRANTPEQDYEYISLDRNYHAVKKPPTLFNGWIRGFMTGAWYAWNCDCDFIYVEQDCIAIGQKWVQACYDRSESNSPLFGAKFRNPVQQSLVFVPHGRIPRFLYLLTQILKPMTCEARFHEISKIKHGMGYKLIPFGVGRDRPIPWHAGTFYAQHWSDKELIELGRRQHVNGMISKLLGGE